jgi:hypothetical protein
MAESGGDFLVAAVAEQADGGISEGRQILGSVSALDLPLFFAEGHVAQPVQVFQAPMDAIFALTHSDAS